MLAAVTAHYKSKAAFMNSSEQARTGSVTLYDLHDRKMLYLLTQHSSWNRKNHPFLMCKCMRGDGVKDEQHQCNMMNNAEVTSYWERSKEYWEMKQEEVRNGKMKEYSLQTHMEFVDECNFGIAHFGLHPNLLNYKNIRYDTFHMKCAIT